MQYGFRPYFSSKSKMYENTFQIIFNRSPSPSRNKKKAKNQFDIQFLYLTSQVSFFLQLDRPYRSDNR